MSATITDYTPEANTITMFTTSWCGYCKSLKKMLKSTDIQLNEIDIETEPGTEELVKSVNNGNAVVPTVVFPDGSTATNPSIDEVQARVQ
jgi:mycoredoxin